MVHHLAGRERARDEQGRGQIQEWWPDAAFRSQIGKLAAALKLEGALAVLDRDPLTGLAHLREPAKLRTLAALAAFILLHQRGKQLPAAAVRGAPRKDAREAVTPNVSPAEAVSGSDTLLAKAVFGGDGEGLIVVSAPREAFATLTSSPDRAAVTLRLDDSAERRKTPTFQTVWRQALRAWNLLQALRGAVVASAEQLAIWPRTRELPVGRGALVRSKALSEAPPRKAPSVAPPGALSVQAEGVLAEIQDPRAREVVRASRRVARREVAPGAVRGAGGHGRGGIGDIEVGWPDERVGAYLDEQREATERLRARGWRCSLFSRAVRVVLLHVLGIEEA